MFGAKKSPVCANYALTKSLEIDNLPKNVFMDDFYMNDFIYISALIE